jgi:hypothetical protein
MNKNTDTLPQPRRTRKGTWQVPSLFTYETRERAERAIAEMVEHPDRIAMGRPYSYWLATWDANRATRDANDKREARRERDRARRRR